MFFPIGSGGLATTGYSLAALRAAKFLGNSILGYYRPWNAHLASQSQAGRPWHTNPCDRLLASPRIPEVAPGPQDGIPAQLAATNRVLHARLWLLGGFLRGDARECRSPCSG